MSAQLATWLIDERVLPEATVQAAAARQLVYGGALDTAILEMGAMTEVAIWGRLSAATGLPVPTPALCDGQLAEMPPSLDARRTGPLRAVPVAAEAGTLKLLCAEPVAIDEILTAAAESGFAARLYVVPEVRLLAARQRVYQEPLPARYAPLLARILGAERVRKNHANHAAPRPVTPPPERPEPPRPPEPSVEMDDLEEMLKMAAMPEPPERGGRAEMTEVARNGGAAPTPLEQVLDLSGALRNDSSQGSSGPLPEDSSLELDFEIQGGAQPTREPATEGEPAAPQAMTFGPESDSGNHPATAALCRRARDPLDKGRTLALRALRQRLTHPAVQALLEELRAVATAGEATEAIEAIEALAELRDQSAIPAFIQGLDRATPPDVAQAIHRALVALTAQDFGRSRRRWQAWLQRSGRRPRTEWLLDGLAHKQPEIRTAAFEELRQLSGDSFGYVFDSPKREREEARRRWLSWWEDGGGTPEDPILSGSLLGAADESPLPPAPKPR